MKGNFTKPYKFKLLFVLGMCQDVPAYNFGKKYNKFAFRSLLTREESINAKGKVAIECNEVAGKCLYHVPTTKPMRIEEFEQTQAQVTSQVCLV